MDMLTFHLNRIGLDGQSTSGGPVRVALPFNSMAGTADGGRPARARTAGEPGHADRQRRHDPLVLKGEAEAIVGDEQATLVPGQLAVVPDTTPHGIRTVGSNRLRLLGFFSRSTVVTTFDEPLGPDDPRRLAVDAQIPLAEAARD